jgi:hypothetical protein
MNAVKDEQKTGRGGGKYKLDIRGDWEGERVPIREIDLHFEVDIIGARKQVSSWTSASIGRR